MRVFHVADAENDERENQQKSQREVREKHVLVKIVLKRDSCGPIEPLQKGDAGQIS